MKIDELIKEAYKSSDKTALNAYRNVKAEIQKVLTAKNAPEYSEKLFIHTVAKYGRRLEDSICQFEQAKREDLVDEYRSELEVVKKLLPKPVNESQIRSELYNHGLTVGWSECKIIEGTRSCETKVQIPKKEMGKCIKYLKDKFPTADGKLISDVIKEYVV